MKRIISFILFFAMAYLAFQFGVVFIKNNHNVDYSLKVLDKVFFISESYIKDKNDELYLVTIKVDNKEFIFDIDNRFNKRRNIVKDILVYEEDDLMCIYPIFINNETIGELECNIDGELYSYFSIKDKYNLNPFIITLPKYHEELKNNDKVEKYTDLKIFTNNILDDEHVILYNYKNIINISNFKNHYIVFSLKDVYVNKNGILVGQYYLVPDGNTPGVHSYMTIIDVTADNNNYELPLRNELSSNYYINGVVDNLLYIFDKSSLIQYSIDPANRSIRIEGTKETNCRAYINGKWVDVTAYDLLNEEIIFTEDNNMMRENVEFLGKNNRYYYYKIDDVFYKSYIRKPDKSIQILTYENAKITKMVNDGIYFIDGDTLYRYKDNSIIPLIQRNEFKFNNQNIYEIYWKNQ